MLGNLATVLYKNKAIFRDLIKQHNGLLKKMKFLLCLLPNMFQRAKVQLIELSFELFNQMHTKCRLITWTFADTVYNQRKHS